MKKLFTIAFCLLLAGYVAAQGVFPAAEIWQVPKTSVVPVIDGVMDAVWFNAGEQVCDKLDDADAAPPDDWFDLYAATRLMWDDTNLYIFITIYDDVLLDGIQTGSDYNYDGVELYMDADNSKLPGPPYDGVDDLQWRFNHGETVDQSDSGYGDAASWGDYITGTESAIEDTDLGWNLEIQVPLANIQVEPAAGTVWGFDAQINDADVTLGTRDNMYRWWATNNAEWHNAELFGTVELTGRVISEVLDIPKIASAPVMDGALDEVWKTIPVISDNQFDSATSAVDFTDWTDARFWFRTAWDDENQYFFFDVWDDIISTGTDYNYDSIEFYWDADNSKTNPNPYDGIDDFQMRCNFGDVTDADLDAGFGDAAAWGTPSIGVTFGQEETDHGYTIELAMPLANVQLSPGSDFGFDVQLNDADETTRGNAMKRWWAVDNAEWHNASFFGTANLVGGADGVKDKDATVAGSFALAQNYPNPFNPTTNISYTVDSRSMVKLNVYDVLGKQVGSLVNEVKAPGLYNVTFDASSLTSGVYFYKLIADNKVEAKKMMLVK